MERLTEVIGRDERRDEADAMKLTVYAQDERRDEADRTRNVGGDERCDEADRKMGGGERRDEVWCCKESLRSTGR